MPVSYGRPKRLVEQLALPGGVTFADLRLQREPATRRLLFNAAALIGLCRENCFDSAYYLDTEEHSHWLISVWHETHKKAGGREDRLAEELSLEVAADGTEEDQVLLNYTLDRLH